MERLTKNIGNGYIIDTKLNYGDSVVDMIQKYGKLEDLEEQIGCPLEVRCKLIDGVEVYNAIGEHCVIRRVYEDSIRVYVINPDTCIETDAYMTYKISEYKKTWWLKQDRSEQ